MAARRYFCLILLFFTVVLLDAWLLQSLRETKEAEPEDVLWAVREDMVYFPVPQSSYDTEGYSVSFADSWMESRNFGGERVHEGCDIMAAVNKRGHYPIVSISDGCVENMGWLTLGGYRIGIRSPAGVYFYYAHLSDYAPDLAVGDEVKAGELLGFMGDTGYSEKEGTTGFFPVHLHVGIYLNQDDGEEKSYNPYPFLKELEKKKLKFCFE